MVVIVPRFRVLAVRPELPKWWASQFGRKAMFAFLPKGFTLPVGTPDWVVSCGVTCHIFRGKVNHWHTLDTGDCMPAGWDFGAMDEVIVVADSKRIGKGRRAIRDLLRLHPPVDAISQALRLRYLWTQSWGG